MDEKLKGIGSDLDVSGDDIRRIRIRRIRDIVIVSVVGSIASFLSFLIGFSIGNSEKYGMAYYPFAIVPLVAVRGDRARYAIWGIGAISVALLGVFFYLRGFEAGKVFYSNSILYGVFGKKRSS